MGTKEHPSEALICPRRRPRVRAGSSPVGSLQLQGRLCDHGGLQLTLTPAVLSHRHFREYHLF